MQGGGGGIQGVSGVIKRETTRFSSLCGYLSEILYPPMSCPLNLSTLWQVIVVVMSFNVIKPHGQAGVASLTFTELQMVTFTSWKGLVKVTFTSS